MDENKPQKISSVKITLIGNVSVGKTSILQKFSTGIFPEKAQPTLGIGFNQKPLTIDGTKIICNLWDTSGQEKYRSLGKECFKDAYIVCLVYDITDEKSFQDIRKVWLPFLEENGEKYIILGLVGNKSDLYTDGKVDESNARDYAKTINAEFFLTSAKNGNNIDLVFKKLVSKYLEPEFLQKVTSLKNQRGELFNLDIGNDGNKGNNGNNKEKKKGCC